MTVVEAPTPTEAPAKSRREILLDAAALMEEHGWTQGGKGMPGNADHVGQFCILGAVAYAMGFRDDSEHTYMSASAVVGCEDDDQLAFAWNDEAPHGGNGADVVLALKRLAHGATWEQAIA